MKMRDAQRIHDLRQIQIAIELYYDEHGIYPPLYCGPRGDQIYDISND